MAALLLFFFSINIKANECDLMNSFSLNWIKVLKKLEIWEIYCHFQIFLFYIEPSFFAGVTFQKAPVINEICEVEAFIFEREKKKNDYQKNTKYSRTNSGSHVFHCFSDWAAASWLRSAAFPSSEARGACVFFSREEHSDRQLLTLFSLLGKKILKHRHATIDYVGEL